MKLTIKLFGPDARAVGARELLLEIDRLPISCAALRVQIAAAEPRLAKSVVTARFAVNSQFVPDSSRITAGDEIALIASVSGG